jgi:hypothetical protein
VHITKQTAESVQRQSVCVFTDLVATGIGVRQEQTAFAGESSYLSDYLVIHFHFASC